MNHNKEKDLLKQLDTKMNTIISLLARNLLNDKEIQNILFKRRTKQGKKKALKAYTQFDGEHTLSEVAEKAEMDPGNLSRYLKNWVEEGIVFLAHTKGNEKYFRHVFPVRPPQKWS